MDNKYSAKIIGTGMHVPEKIITNNDLVKILDTTDEWITQKFGIKERHFASESETTSDLCTPAALEAINNSGLKPIDIELIILASSIGDVKTPATSAIIQNKIGATKSAVFDLHNGCSGFVTALITASKFIADGTYKNVLVIGSSIYSKELDPTDRTKYIVFGDGAGAVVLTRCPSGEGLVSYDLGTDGSKSHILNVPYGESKYPARLETVGNREMRYGKPMEGKEIFEFATNIIPMTINKSLAKINLSSADLDFVILHQANINIIKIGLDKLGLGLDKTFTNIDKYGNTSEASIPITLHESLKLNKIKKGDLVAMSAFGVGLSWATVILKWA